MTWFPDPENATSPPKNHFLFPKPAPKTNFDGTINFESATLNYAFTNFGGATTTVVNNPNVSGGNGSTKVAKLTKSAGSEVWAGSFIELGSPINFATMQKIKIKA